MRFLTYLYKKTAQLLLSLFITFSLIACNPNESTSIGKKPQTNIRQTTTQQTLNSTNRTTKYHRYAQVIRVVDGDTLKVRLNGKNERIRLTLIDAPETNIHFRGTPQAYAIEAKNFLADLVEGKTIQLERDVEEKDPYNRYLFYAYINGKSVQEELIRHGYARVAKFPPNVKYFDQYSKIEDQAKQQKKRIWSIDNYVTDRGFDSKATEHFSTMVN